MSNYPTSLDTTANLPDTIADSSLLSNPDHATLHNTISDAVLALEEKVGTGTGSTASAGYFLVGTGSGSADWSNTQIISSVSSNTGAGSASATHYVYLVSGTTQITLPTTGTSYYSIKNIGTNTVTIATTGGATIDGSSTLTLPIQYTSVDLVPNGSNWSII